MVWSVETRQAGPALPGPRRARVRGRVLARRQAAWPAPATTGGSCSGIPRNSGLSNSVPGRTGPPRPRSEYSVLEGHAAGVRTLQYSANGKLLLSGGHDNTVRVWDVASRKAPEDAPRPRRDACRPARLAPIRPGCFRGATTIWRKSGASPATKKSACFRAACWRGTATPSSARCSRPTAGTSSAPAATAARNCGTPPRAGRFASSRKGTSSWRPGRLSFPDGKRLLSAAVDNTTRIWDVATGTQLFALDGTGPAAAVALVPRRPAAPDRQRRQGGETVGRRSPDGWCAKLEGHRSEVTAVADFPRQSPAVHRRRPRPLPAVGGARPGSCSGKPKAIRGTSPRRSSCPTATRCSRPASTIPWPSGTWRPGANGCRGSSSIRRRWWRWPSRPTAAGCSPPAPTRRSGCGMSPAANSCGMLPAGDEMTNAVAFSPGRPPGGDDDRHRATSGCGTWSHSARSAPARPSRGRGLSPGTSLSQAWSAVLLARRRPGSHGRRQRSLPVGREDRPAGYAVQPAQLGGFRAVLARRPTRRHRQLGQHRRIWNVETGLAELRLEGAHTQSVNDAAFSPDGAQVVTASDDKTACLWDATTGQVRSRLRGHEQRVGSAVFSADGSRVLTASNDKTARIWDARTGQLLHVLRGHQQAVLHGAFSATAPGSSPAARTTRPSSGTPRRARSCRSAWKATRPA